jgi:uncharacterized protein YjbJ (UPF0337 family)
MKPSLTPDTTHIAAPPTHLQVTEHKMNHDQKEGIKEQVKGWTDTAIGTVTGNEDRKVKGDVEITNGANRKDYGDQKDNIEKGVEDPGEPTDQ